jgi:hypothetical protein
MTGLTAWRTSSTSPRFRPAVAVYSFDQFGGAAVEGDGLLVGVPVPGPVPGRREVGHRVGGVGAVGVVVGEQFALLEAVGMGMLEGGAGPNRTLTCLRSPSIALRTARICSLMCRGV